MKFFLILTTILAGFLVIVAAVGEYLELEQTADIAGGSLVALGIIVMFSLYGWALSKI